jgi:uncharacterized protein
VSFIKHDQTQSVISDVEMHDLADIFLLAINSRNWDMLRMIITKDCIWRWPGTDDYSGTAIGADSVIKEITSLVDRIYDSRLINILYGLNGVAISLHFHTKMRGREIDEDLVTVCVLRGHLISGINTYLTNADGIEIP